MKKFSYCPFCGSKIEFVPFDGGQAAFLEPWCDGCNVGFHRGAIEKSLLGPHERWDCLVGNISSDGTHLKPKSEWTQI